MWPILLQFLTVLSVVTWIFQYWYMDFFKLLYGFANCNVATWICLSCFIHLSKYVVLCILHSLPNKTKLKFDQDFKPCWSLCFEQKVLNESKYLIPLAMFSRHLYPKSHCSLYERDKAKCENDFDPIALWFKQINFRLNVPGQV